MYTERKTVFGENRALELKGNHDEWANHGKSLKVLPFMFIVGTLVQFFLLNLVRLRSSFFGQGYILLFQSGNPSITS